MRSLVTDPLRNFKFLVTIAVPNGSAVPTTIAKLGFMTADGLGIQNEVIPYREGGDNTTTRKMPGQTDFGPITLARGAMSVPVGPRYTTGAGGTNEIEQWMSQVFSAMEGQGLAVSASADFRTNVTIDVLEHPKTDPTYGAGLNNPPPIKLRYYVFNAWPMGLNYSGLDAGGNAILVQTLQLAHEGFVPIYAPSNAPGVYLGVGTTP